MKNEFCLSARDFYNLPYFSIVMQNGPKYIWALDFDVRRFLLFTESEFQLLNIK